MTNVKGYSIIELIIVIVLTSIVVGVPALFLKNGFDGYFTSQALSGLSTQAGNAMSRMVKDIENTKGLTTISTTTLTLTAADGSSISYTLSGSTLNRSVNGGTNFALTDGVSALAFTYYNAAGSTESTAANVRLITISLTLQSTNPTQSFPLINTVFLRSMP